MWHVMYLYLFRNFVGDDLKCFVLIDKATAATCFIDVVSEWSERKNMEPTYVVSRSSRGIGVENTSDHGKEHVAWKCCQCEENIYRREGDKGRCWRREAARRTTMTRQR